MSVYEPKVLTGPGASGDVASIVAESIYGRIGRFELRRTQEAAETVDTEAFGCMCPALVFSSCSM
jgi:hypothetical protein